MCNIKMMREVLVKVPETYEREKDIGGIKIALSNQVDDVKDTIRYGEVLSVPILFETNLKIGDTIYFHHNVIRKPTKITSEYEYTHGMFDFDRSKGLYQCPLELIYAIERDGEVMALEPWCYIAPLDYDGKEDRMVGFGIVKYGNKQLDELGYVEGTKIIYSKDSDYTFDIKGEHLYRMQTKDIIGRLG